MRLWTKNYVITIIINLLIFIVFFLYMQYIANMAIVRFGASVSSAGLAPLSAPPVWLRDYSLLVPFLRAS